MEIFGDRPAAAANDLTKMFETIDRGKLSQLLEKFQSESPRGEYTLVINGSDRKASEVSEMITDEQESD